jgi:integrase/recombinase XerD
MAVRQAPKRSDAHFHSMRSEHASSSIQKGLDKGILTEKDVSLIRDFIATQESCNNISLARTNKLVFTLVGWRRFIGPFDQLTIQEVYSGVSTLKTAKSERGTPFKQNTLRDFVSILKQFLFWMTENGYLDIPESKLRKLKTPSKDMMTKVAGDLLTPDEITSMVAACNRSMDRAVIMMLYEGGFRIGEIGALRWNDLKFDQFGVVANVNFKTEKPRYIRLIMAREHLAKWKNDYPFTPEGDALVFITERKTPLTHASIQKQLTRIADRVGIEKHITPHVFRHSRITHMVQQGVQESVIKQMMWGNISTGMFQTYAHLSGTDIDQEMMKLYGITNGGKKFEHPRLEPRQCDSCDTVNAPTSNFCSTCGKPLTEQVTSTLEDKVLIARNSPEYKELLRMLKQDLK